MVGATSAWAASGILRASPATGDRMHTRPIPSTREPLPVVGCGTWRTFDVGQGPAERAPLVEVLRILFDNGGLGDRLLADVRRRGGRRRRFAGDDAGARQGVYRHQGVDAPDAKPASRRCERSMELLRTDRIDLMQVHNLVDWRTQLATLRAWKKEGRIRYVGITHYTPSAYDELESVMRAETPDFVQLDYALNDRAAEQRLLPLAADRGIAVIVNRPFGGGGLLQSMLAQAAARMGRRHRLRELGAGAAEIRARQSRGDLRHSRHRQARAHEGQRARGIRRLSRRDLARKDGGYFAGLIDIATWL